MHILHLALLAAIIATAPAPSPAPAAPGAPWRAVSLSASASPSQVLPDATVTYTDVLTNSGAVAGSGLRLAHTLPSDFGYIAGSASIYRDGIMIGVTDPVISGHTLIWSGLTVPARRGDSFFGINTMVQERCDAGYTAWQLDHARNLMEYGAWDQAAFLRRHRGDQRTSTLLERLHQCCLRSWPEAGHPSGRNSRRLVLV